MQFEELLRYTIPGYIVLTPITALIWSFYPYNNQVAPSDSVLATWFGALVILGPAAGFIIHQLHMLRHEMSGYASVKRRTLKLIIENFKATTSNGENQNISGPEALLAWDYFFHTDVIDDDLRNHIIRTWYFIHSFRGVAWAFGIGLTILIVAFFMANQNGSPNSILLNVIGLAIIIYFISLIFLRFKAYTTEQFLWSYEEYTVLEHWDAIKGHLERILAASGDGNIHFFKG